MTTFRPLALALALAAPAAAAPAADLPAGPVSAYTYARQAQSADVFAREASRMLLESSADPALRRFAEGLADAHRRSRDRFDAAAGNPAPGNSDASALLSADERRLRKLRRANADRRDRVFLEEQIEVHEAALALHEHYARAGAHARLRRAAATAAPLVAAHLAELRRLQESR